MFIFDKLLNLWTIKYTDLDFTFQLTGQEMRKLGS